MLESVSRLAPQLLSPEHLDAGGRLLALAGSPGSTVGDEPPPVMGLTGTFDPLPPGVQVVEAEDRPAWTVGG